MNDLNQEEYWPGFEMICFECDGTNVCFEEDTYGDVAIICRDCGNAVYIVERCE